MKNKFLIFNFKFLNSKKGFTLIELLVVISIIGILASLALVSYSGAQKQTRDTERRSDLGQYRNALETYASSNSGLYPKNTYNGNSLDRNGIFSDSGPLISAGYLASFIPDPLNAETSPAVTFKYYYTYYGSTDGVSYKLVAGLETGGYWEVCSTGKSGKVTTEPTADTTCNL